jgi:hypothetical protein
MRDGTGHPSVSEGPCPHPCFPQSSNEHRQGGSLRHHCTSFLPVVRGGRRRGQGLATSRACVRFSGVSHRVARRPAGAGLLHIPPHRRRSLLDVIGDAARRVVIGHLLLLPRLAPQHVVQARDEQHATDNAAPTDQREEIRTIRFSVQCHCKASRDSEVTCLTRSSHSPGPLVVGRHGVTCGGSAQVKRRRDKTHDGFSKSRKRFVWCDLT